MENSVIKGLNEQLQGVIMGEKEFLKLIEKANDENLIDSLNNSIKIIEKHKRFLREIISEENYKPSNNEGVLGKIIEGFSNIINLTIDEDKEVIKSTIKGLSMGVKSIKKLLEEFNANLPENIKLNFLNILNEYKNNIDEYEKLL